MIRNTQDGWGWPAVVLHWVIALLVIGLFGFGLWMNEVPARPDRPFYYAIHASIGITILALMVVRLAWWWRNTTPVLPDGVPAWHSRVSKISHRLLYALTFALLVVGWLLSGTMRQPIEPMLFGLIPVPQHSRRPDLSPSARVCARVPGLCPDRSCRRARRRGALSPLHQAQQRSASHARARTAAHVSGSLMSRAAGSGPRQQKRRREAPSSFRHACRCYSPATLAGRFTGLRRKAGTLSAKPERPPSG